MGCRGDDRCGDLRLGRPAVHCPPDRAPGSRHRCDRRQRFPDDRLSDRRAVRRCPAATVEPRGTAPLLGLLDDGGCGNPRRRPARGGSVLGGRGHWRAGIDGHDPESGAAAALLGGRRIAGGAGAAGAAVPIALATRPALPTAVGRCRCTGRAGRLGRLGHGRPADDRNAFGLRLAGGAVRTGGRDGCWIARRSANSGRSPGRRSSHCSSSMAAIASSSWHSGRWWWKPSWR